MKKGLIKKFRAYYSKHGQIHIPGRDKDNNPIEKQTDWVWFDRETIEEALKKADADGKIGGLKMYIGQYDKETISMLPKERPEKEEYIGRISLVLVPADMTKAGPKDIGGASDSDDSDEEEEDAWNGGRICPPYC
ncbi:hypothetical protein [Belliella pelovolcani]|uniref:Uncharacterized protein n=1 Tax=Belliella pelovolcani TaxID=529505 RepID=A0A1N7JRS5_9BACT|nr:hypothetical protein [Belliella pelovolcani]SIS51924.1 hypothetical protein SAMN05421761_101213 [Belliella pelovolcani]